MPTGDLKTNLADKRFLPQQRLKDTWFDYHSDQIKETTSRVWASRRGVFGTATLTGGTDVFNVTTAPLEFLDGDGNILILGTSEATSVPFENAAATYYHVAVRHVEVPSGVVINPRNNVKDYDMWEDRIGETGDPDTVVESSGQLTITVDSVFESGHSHAGRLVTVFLKNPVSNVESEAIERNLVVVWDGTNNKVTTSGLLGQSAGSASTNTAMYTVIAQGVTVRLSSAGLDSTDPYAFIGTVTGGGSGNPPAGFSTTGQINVTSGISPDLQAAYNLGRTINTSSTYGGAVNIQSTNSGDGYRAGLVVNRMASATSEDGSGALYLLQDEDTGIGIAVLSPVHDAGTNIYEQEAVTTAASDIVNFTRGGVDLVTGGTNPYADFLLIQGTTSLDGLYLIDDMSATSITVQALGGGSPSGWAASQSGNGTLLRARMLGWCSGGFGASSTYGETVGQRGVEFHGGPGSGDSAVRMLGYAAPALELSSDDVALKVEGAIQALAGASSSVDLRQTKQTQGFQVGDYSTTDDILSSSDTLLVTAGTSTNTRRRMSFGVDGGSVKYPYMFEDQIDYRSSVSAYKTSPLLATGTHKWGWYNGLIFEPVAAASASHFNTGFHTDKGMFPRSLNLQWDGTSLSSPGDRIGLVSTDVGVHGGPDGNWSTWGNILFAIPGATTNGWCIRLGLFGTSDGVTLATQPKVYLELDTSNTGSNFFAKIYNSTGLVRNIDTGVTFSADTLYSLSVSVGTTSGEGMVWITDGTNSGGWLPTGTLGTMNTIPLVLLVEAERVSGSGWAQCTVEMFYASGGLGLTAQDNIV